jgi:murein DD-endopeptidase MepM/ murein hydrolase activator NlpD
MYKAAFWSRVGRGAWRFVAAGLLLGAGGCSSGATRFDYPAFHLMGSEGSASGAPSAASASYAADPASTASLPVPPESVYASSNDGSSGRGGYTGSTGNGGYGSPRVARADLPPPLAAELYTPAPHRLTPRVTPASYAPAPLASVQPRKAAYAASAPLRPEPAVVRTASSAGSERTYKVREGDTLSEIARRHNVTVEALKEANHLPNIRLDMGQVLTIPGPGTEPQAQAESTPAPKTYRVQKGDTPHVIAQKLHVSEKALTARNTLRTNDLQIGQVLVVPGADDREENADSPREIETAAKPKKERTPFGSKPGAQTAESNSGSVPDVHVVRTTPIPALGTPASHVETAGGTESASTAPSPSPSVAGSPEVTGLAAKSAAPAADVASVEQLPAPDPMSGTIFRWPVQGRIIAAFGTKPDGSHNDGIDVAVPQGTSVKAAENGVVAYAGNELKGYGNLVLIRHANNWVSAYAHNEEILVKRGDKVRRGQIIARAGNTGSVSQPQLHFELRKGSRPVDPPKYMNQTAASAD